MKRCSPEMNPSTVTAGRGSARSKRLTLTAVDGGWVVVCSFCGFLLVQKKLNPAARGSPSCRRATRERGTRPGTKGRVAGDLIRATNASLLSWRRRWEHRAGLARRGTSGTRAVPGDRPLRCTPRSSCISHLRGAARCAARGGRGRACKTHTPVGSAACLPGLLLLPPPACLPCLLLYLH